MQLRDALVCLILLGVLIVPVRRAQACGPDFPHELLRDRKSTLANLPENDFMSEATRLVPRPADAFKVVEEEAPEGARTGAGERETALYTAGAEAFHRNDLETARRRFEEVLSLPDGERRRFTSFATFMLARLEEDKAQARARFAEVRALVRQGFEDPLGLAVSSLGEEARLLLWDKDDAGAIALYAEQAAHGSGSGAASLLFVARAVSMDEARLQAVLRSPVGQRLMAAYAWTRGHEQVWSESLEASRPAPLQRLMEALAAQPQLSGADRLAAVAWQEGRFDLAERFAGVERTPLAAWVQAKLAMRRGAPAEAERLLAEAAAGFPAEENWQSTPYEYAVHPRSNVEGERALLALMRGDFTQAAERVLQTCSWPDIAYVAERVLTVEELQRLLVAPASGPALECRLNLMWYEEGQAPSVKERLRLLLGRRLMRDGQGGRALEYFQGSQWEQSARQYVDALERGGKGSAGPDRAEALYAASRLARSAGFDVLGTEVAPDWVWALGDFEVDEFYSWREEEAAATPESQAWLTRLVLTPDAERKRLESHAPRHIRRFQYRSIAADLAEQAAEQVPPRSQAYAALLCHAARYSSRSDPERVQRLWSTYVKKGALLQEPMNFGVECPAPDFERVRHPKSGAWQRPRLRTLASVGGGLMVLPVVGLALLRRRRQAPPAPGGT